LKQSEVLCPACGTDWELQTVQRARKVICEERLQFKSENQSLRSRCERLEEALKAVAPSWLPEAIRLKRQEALREDGET
jgi:hypothetical protein